MLTVQSVEEARRVMSCVSHDVMGQLILLRERLSTRRITHGQLPDGDDDDVCGVQCGQSRLQIQSLSDVVQKYSVLPESERLFMGWISVSGNGTGERAISWDMMRRG